MTSIVERFEKKWIPEPTTGCWLWYGATTSTGYGNFNLGKVWRKAHRVALWLYRNAPLDDKRIAIHRCDNKACVNPDHLFLGTNAENQLDMARKRRGRKSALPFGVTRKRDLYQAQVTRYGRHYYLGMFKTPEAAAIAASQKREELEAR